LQIDLNLQSQSPTGWSGHKCKIPFLSFPFQHLNLDKVKAVIIHQQPSTRTTIAGVKVVASMKILGLEYNHLGCAEGNLTTRRGKGQSKAILHASRLKTRGCQHDPTISKLMAQMDVRPTLMFGAPIWGHAQMLNEDPMRHPLQKPYSTLPRRAMQLPPATAHWIVAMMSGLLPIRHWILRDFCRFWNGLMELKETNTLLKSTISQQHTLLTAFITRSSLNGREPFTRNSQPTTWLTRWCKVFKVLLPNGPFYQNIVDLVPMDEDCLLRELGQAYHTLLQHTGDPFAQQCAHRHTALSYKLLRPHLQWGKVPLCVQVRTPPHAKLAWVMFLAAASDVPVHDHRTRRTDAGMIQYNQVICAKCRQHAVADIQHVLLHCTATEHVRSGFPQVVNPTTRLSDLTKVSAVRRTSHAPFFVYTCLAAYKRAPTNPDQHVPPLHQPGPTEYSDVEDPWETATLAWRVENGETLQRIRRRHIPARLRVRTRVIDDDG
jgi:hypothetical protein